MAAATSVASIMCPSRMDCSVRPLPSANSVLMPPGAEHAYLDTMPAKLGVERLGESDLREFRGAVDGFSGVALQAGD